MSGFLFEEYEGGYAEWLYENCIDWDEFNNKSKLFKGEVGQVKRFRIVTDPIKQLKPKPFRNIYTEAREFYLTLVQFPPKFTLKWYIGK